MADMILIESSSLHKSYSSSAQPNLGTSELQMNRPSLRTNSITIRQFVGVPSGSLSITRENHGFLQCKPSINGQFSTSGMV